ncbi:MAG: hypothetical protein WCE44_16780 [Candidatus Velthaea sp.]
MTIAHPWLGWLAVAAIAVSVSPVAAQQPALDAQEIFARARSTAEARKLPPFLEYTTYAAFIRKGHVVAEHLHVVVRTADGVTFVTPVPDSPSDRISTAPYVQKAPPYFWPATTFGLARAQTHDSQAIGNAEGVTEPSPEPSPLAVIGAVKVVSYEYDATLAGTETLEGASVYHLLLVPRFDPQKHRLREVFVDTATFQTRRIVAVIVAHAGPIHSQPSATLDYSPVGDGWIVSHGTIDFVLRFGPFAYAGAGEFRLTGMSAPPDEPAWMFDAAKLAAHQRG